MHPVFSLIPNYRVGSFDHFVRHLFPTVPGQAVHENEIRLCKFQHPLIDLVRTKLFRPLFLLLLGSSHAVPRVGVDDIGVLKDLLVVLAQNDLCSGLFGSLHGTLMDFRIGRIAVRASQRRRQSPWWRPQS